MRNGDSSSVNASSAKTGKTLKPSPTQWLCFRRRIWFTGRIFDVVILLLFMSADKQECCDGEVERAKMLVEIVVAITRPVAIIGMHYGARRSCSYNAFVRPALLVYRFGIL